MTKVAVCLIVKDEAKYMVEWIAHYLALGFDEILVYDNSSTDETYRVVESIARREQAVQLRAWPDVEGAVPQLTAYNDALGRVRCEWLAFFDADELLVLKQHARVQEFLEGFPDRAGAVAINWMLFGSSGHKTYEDRLQSLRFRLRAKDEEHTKNRFVKSIVRVRAAESASSHTSSLKRGFAYYNGRAEPVDILDGAKTAVACHDYAQLNHYVVRSRQEFEEKRARGNVARSADAPDKFARDEEFWSTHNTNHLEDSAIDRWIERAEPIRNRLRAHLSEDGCLEGATASSVKPRPYRIVSATRDIRRHVDFINASALFDRDWYLERYPDVRMLDLDPVEHYVRVGAALRRNPHPLFDAAWYASHHTDIAQSGTEPLVHFLKHGRFEGRKTLPVDGRHPTYSLCVDRRGGIDHKRDHWDALRETAFLEALERLDAWKLSVSCGVSVIMPTYNRREKVVRAIRSVLAQTHEAWELLVVDDGSTDDTQAAVAPLLKDPRISYIRQAQGGVAKARNTGLRAASMAYVGYLDSDNTWRDDFLATMTAFMSATGLDAAYSGAYCSGDGAVPPDFRGDDFCWSSCLEENYVDMNCFMHRRDMVDRFGNCDERLLRLVDWDLILRLTRETRTSYAPFCGVNYYEGAAGRRISNVHYQDGSLETVASKIRAKHAAQDGVRIPRLTAEELLMEVGVPREQFIGSSAQASPAYDRRIGYVVWDWPVLSQTFVVNEVRALIESGCDVVVYYRARADMPANLDFEVRSFAVDGARALVELARSHGRTVLHSPFAYPATTLLTWPCSMETGIPFTFMPGGVDISHYENMKRNRVADVASSAGCLGVVALGTYHHDFLVEQGVPADKIVLRPQAVVLPPFRPRYRVRPRPRVIAIGRFVEKKGLDILVQAAASLPDADFHLYGYGPLEDDLRMRARRLGLRNVQFEAPLRSLSALHDAYGSADVFALPCVRAANGDLDGMPTVILEAMAAGVPVVSTRISNIPDLILDGETGLLATPGDVASLVDTLRRALDLAREQRRRLIDSARQRVERYADTRRSISTLERIWSTGRATARATPAYARDAMDAASRPARHCS